VTEQDRDDIVNQLKENLPLFAKGYVDMGNEVKAVAEGQKAMEQKLDAKFGKFDEKFEKIYYALIGGPIFGVIALVGLYLQFKNAVR